MRAWISDLCSSELGFEQSRLHIAVGPAPTERLNARRAPFGHRSPAAVTVEDAGAACRGQAVGDRAAIEARGDRDRDTPWLPGAPAGVAEIGPDRLDREIGRAHV